MHVWRHMLLTLWFVDSLFFATPKSKRVLMGTKVGGEVHGEGQRNRKSARGMTWPVSNLFSGSYATPKSKRVLMHAWRLMLLTRWFVASLYLAMPKSRRVC